MSRVETIEVNWIPKPDLTRVSPCYLTLVALLSMMPSGIWHLFYQSLDVHVQGQLVDSHETFGASMGSVARAVARSCYQLSVSYWVVLLRRSVEVHDHLFCVLVHHLGSVAVGSMP